MTKTISIFGATGSIGQNTVDLILRSKDAYSVQTVSGANNIELLAETAKKIDAQTAVTSEPDNLLALQNALTGTGIKAQAGREALLEAAEQKTDWAMSALVGFAGLEVSLALARSTSVLALANKESLVCAGPLIHKEIASSGATLLPVDSEHSAIFQAIGTEEPKSIERIILTASGGPFLSTPVEDVGAITPEMAIKHPRWEMGKRISIDSASMFNKAMEVIETYELFDVSAGQIEVIVHPQSIVHSMVGFKDGAIMAHLGPADMRGPIGFALNWPDRANLPLERLDFANLGRLDFQEVDHDRFPALKLAFRALELGGLAGTCFNAAKEKALDLFLIGKITFPEMARLVEGALTIYEGHYQKTSMTLENVKELDATIRDAVERMSKQGFAADV